MAERRENEFEKLARLIKEEGEDIREDIRAGFRTELGNVSLELGGKIDSLEKKVDEGFTGVNRRFDTIIQVQLDEHAGRIKKLERVVFK